MLLFVLVPRTGSQWFALVLAYLLGAIPFGLLLGFLRGVDVRKTGSGNIGATNVGRALGRGFAYLAFVADFAKGWVPVAWLAPALADGHERWVLAVLCGCAAVCGHVWPIYLGFRGGKGVATLCGVVAGIDPVVFLCGGAVWLITLTVTRYVGLSSMLMGLSFPFFAALRMHDKDYGVEVFWGTLLLSALVFVRHRGNIGRMIAGTEPRIRERTTSGAPR